MNDSVSVKAVFLWEQWGDVVSTTLCVGEAAAENESKHNVIQVEFFPNGLIH